jgi:hypothetical protein
MPKKFRTFPTAPEDETILRRGYSGSDAESPDDDPPSSRRILPPKEKRMRLGSKHYCSKRTARRR